MCASFAISFDYMDEAVVEMTTGEAGATGFVERFAAMGAPWTFGFHDLPALAGEAGLAIADATSVGKLHRFYWPDRPVGVDHLRPLFPLHAHIPAGMS